jgi:hypothetical protein
MRAMPLACSANGIWATLKDVSQRTKDLMSGIGFPVYNRDNLFAYKWRDYKIHFIELDSMFESPKPLNMPRLYNLIKDPKELYPLDKVSIPDIWFMPVVFEMIVAHKKSLAIEPPIRLGTPDPYVPPKKTMKEKKRMSNKAY